ncbi:hypothetical protein [Bradyrhizobium brasilense]|uniref:Uncharacterized protein n=1 Tax=Bradyrhizobium brasilense TaxID=1419277 RepID=A0A1G7HI09_9BRAD|nr:hypothetical protein [Bradyrhizobium brasilense]MCC8974935.1 hypothetical protein [Bradyrhizobium brasilense]SDE99991.1 hypothetical protein SAMN05216337_10426 [Bradyrhizobium brasilense]
MSESVPVLVENAVQIAWEFLERSGEITDGYETSQFLVRTIGKMALAGERRKLMLANRAIDAYRKSRPEVA